MKLFALAALLLCAGSSAQAAGVREIQLAADAKGRVLSAMVWSPCARPPNDLSFANAPPVRGVRDCPVQGAKLPLILVSHGLGGNAFSHHDTAEALADGGFIVAALNHPLPDSWMERPASIKRLLDDMIRASAYRDKIDAGRIGFFGFSRGAYTGLVLAGATAEFPPSIRDEAARLGQDRALPPRLRNPEPRIKAFAIADPLGFFSDQASVEKVTAPIQLWSSEQGGQGVTPKDVAAIAAHLAARADYHPVPNSTHLSFIFPCPADVAKRAGAVCVDPPGFDRAAFHRQFDAAVLAFFRKSLPPPRP